MDTTITAGRILDLLVHAASDERLGMTVGPAHVYNYRRTFDAMTTAERLAFDLFLVRTKDALAYEAGTVEHRFATRVRRMAVLAETGKLPGDA